MSKPEEEFYLLSLKHGGGGNALFWRPHGRGYTTNILTAGRYSAADAQRHSSEDTVPVPCDAVVALAVYTVPMDFGALLRAAGRCLNRGCTNALDQEPGTAACGACVRGATAPAHRVSKRQSTETLCGLAIQGYRTRAARERVRFEKFSEPPDVGCPTCAELGAFEDAAFLELHERDCENPYCEGCSRSGRV